MFVKQYAKHSHIYSLLSGKNAEVCIYFVLLGYFSIYLADLSLNYRVEVVQLGLWITAVKRLRISLLTNLYRFPRK